MFFDPFCGFGNPTRDAIGGALRCVDPGGRAPETWKWKRAEVALDILTDISRMRVDIKHLPAIRRIHRARGDGVIRGGIHVVPPKKFRAGELGIALAEFFPDFPAMHEVVRL